MRARRIAATLALAALSTAQAVMPNPEPVDLEPDILAELARHKARTASQARQDATSRDKSAKSANPDTACGAVAIGNVIGNRRIGFAPIDVNVVILGDVVNANNKCR